jgi:hypothetical protein
MLGPYKTTSRYQIFSRLDGVEIVRRKDLAYVFLQGKEGEKFLDSLDEGFLSERETDTLCSAYDDVMEND